MKSIHLVIVGFLGAATILAACGKEPLNHLTPEDTRIYITNFDSSADFSTFKTYTIADSAAVISNGQSSKELDAADAAYIAAVDKYMQQRGFIKVPKDQNPDIGLTVNRIYNTSTGYIDFADYWDYYGGYWDPYYWGYPGYGYYVPYAYAVYQVTEGAVSVDMLDLKDATGHNKIDFVWTGLIRGEGILNVANADSQVQALFAQSPYLQPTN